MCYRRPAGGKQQSTGLLHLDYSNLLRIMQKAPIPEWVLVLFGDPPEIRTPDPLLKRQFF